METNLKRLAATIPEEKRPPAKKKKTAAGEKRLPQRGLGVAKLQKLMLQEQLRKAAETENPAENPTSQDQIHGGIRLPPSFSLSFPSLQQCAESARLGFQVQSQSIFTERCRILRPDSAYSFSCSAAKHAVGSSAELPSNQISPLSERCGASSRTVEDRRQRATEKKPLELFPSCSGSRGREDRDNGSEDQGLDLTLRLGPK